MFNIAAQIIPLIKTKLTELKISPAIIDQIIAFVEPKIKNIDIAKLPEQADHIKTQTFSFLDSKTSMIGADKVTLIKNSLEQVLTQAKSGNLPTDLIPGTDIDNRILKGLSGVANIGGFLSN